MIPIIVIGAIPAMEHELSCLNLGGKEYLKRPVDSNQLKACQTEVPGEKQLERRVEVRVPLTLMLKLRGTDVNGKAFELQTLTDDVSLSGFLCSCAAPLERDAIVEVWQAPGGVDQRTGHARVARVERVSMPRQRYGFQFVDKPQNWILQ